MTKRAVFTIPALPFKLYDQVIILKMMGLRLTFAKLLIMFAMYYVKMPSLVIYSELFLHQRIAVNFIFF